MNMEDLGHSTLNASSLIDLKAELHKKYESFRNLKHSQKTVESTKRTVLKKKGECVKEKKVKSAVQPKEEDQEEELALKKSRLALEAKAKLYENIVSNNILIDDEQKDNYLVDFQRKVLYNSQELAQVEEKETTQSEACNIPSYTNESEYETFIKPQGNFVQPDKEEMDQPIHYQNVQFNEVRDHGTGYFAFSMNESRRKEQMEDLNFLRQETEEQRLKKEKLQRKRKLMLHARLSKICERKNIDQSVLATYSKETEEHTESPQKEDIDLTSIPLPEIKTDSENQQTEKKLPKVRPWDIGKDNLQYFTSQKKIKSQNQWVEEKRLERPSEFAPPSSYINNRR